MTNKVLALTTAGSEAEARKIASQLVDRELAACVNIVPRIQSIYRWQGQLETSDEFLLIIKTTKSRSEQVQATIRELHSYELPEYVVISIEGGSAEYLEWIEKSVG